MRGRIQLQSDDGIHLLTRSDGHEEFDAAIGLRKAYLATGQHRRADNLCRDCRQQELALRPFQDVDVYGPVSAGRADLGGGLLPGPQTKYYSRLESATTFQIQRQSLVVLNLVQAVYQSTRTGQPVDIQQS